MNLSYHNTVQEHLGFPIPHFELDETWHHFAADNPRKKPLWAIGKEFTFKGEKHWTVTCGSFTNPMLTKTFKSFDEDLLVESRRFRDKYIAHQNKMNAKIELEKKKKNDECKMKTHELWPTLEKAITHEYLTKKKIDPFAAKIHGENLIIPIYDANGLVGTQSIRPDGFKKFPYGIKIKGSICPMKPFKNAKIVYLAEGFATAATIQMAIEAPVVCCFVANNIPHAIRTIRKINPDCYIINCADRDKPNPQTKERAGEYYAEKIKDIKKVQTIFPWDDVEKIGDFNDLWCETGDLLDVRVRCMVQTEEIDQVDKQRLIDSGFSYYDEKGNVKRDYDTLQRYFEIEFAYFYVPEIKQIYIYNGKYYEKYDDGFVKAFAQQFFEPICTKESERVEFLNYVKSKNVKPIEFIKKRFGTYINFRNGILNYMNGDFFKHTPKMFFDYCIPHDYDKTAKCETFDKLMDNVTCDREELIMVLQEFAGYFISGQPYDRFQKFIILSGKGRNGKTTLINIFQEMLGFENCSAVSMTDLTTNRFAAIKLERSLLNICEEEHKKCFAETGPLKKITGNTLLQVEEKGKPSYSIMNRAKIIMSFNEMPELKDISTGMIRRLEIIPFDLDLKKNPEKSVDINQITENEMSGVINFALEGLQRLIVNDSFTNTIESQNEIERMVKGSDVFYDWVEECVHISGNSMEYISTNNLYENFTDFIGHNRISKIAFSRKMSNYFKANEEVKESRNKMTRGWTGLNII